MKNQQECYMDDKRKEKKKRKKKKKDKVSHITATQQLSEFGFPAKQNKIASVKQYSILIVKTQTILLSTAPMKASSILRLLLF